MSTSKNEQVDTSPLVLSRAHCILLDIEGTTSSISFVYDQLFPFARRELRPYLDTHWYSDDVQKAVTYLTADAGYKTAEDWFKSAKPRVSDPDSVGDPDSETDKLIARAHQELVIAEVERLMDADIKSTGLKELQGLIWAVGYENNQLSSHVFDDVKPAFEDWKNSGIDLRIFSSGSVNAQKVFFHHTKCGALSEYLSGYYDTTTGPKREAESYKLIAANAGFEPADMLFLSDVVPELDAAHQAGLKVALVVRPGNATTESDVYPVINSFDQISIVQQATSS